MEGEMCPHPAAVPDASSLRLEVLGKIASGGMARVDLARVSDSDRLVALKRLHVHLERDPEFVRMFMDEAWMTAAVDHPNIVRLLGFGRDEEGLFLVMDLVAGPSLDGLAVEARRRGSPLPAELLAYVALGVVRGLSAMHELCDRDGNSLDLVHRDLTPSNVLIGVDGTVKITDFGVAKAAGRSSKTSTDVVKGKTRYLSPEYAASRHVDARSDLYTLGLSMFVVATGRQPFEQCDSVRVFKAILTEAPPTITDVEPDFDVALSELASELQRKDPAERPQSARAVQARLEAWIAQAGHTEDALRQQLAQFASRFGGARLGVLERLSRQQGPAHTAETVADEEDLQPTRIAIAQLGAPEEQRTRLATVRASAPAAAQDGPDRRRRRAGTRVVSRRPSPALPGAEPEPPTVSAVAADASEEAIDPTQRLDMPPQPGARSSSSMLTAIVVSSVVAVMAVVAILVTSPGGGSEREWASSTPSRSSAATSASSAASVVDAEATAHVAPTGTPGAAASAGATASAAPASSAGAAARAPTSRPIPGRPSRPVVRPKPRRPCDPSHFDYPECLSR